MQAFKQKRPAKPERDSKIFVHAVADGCMLVYKKAKILQPGLRKCIVQMLRFLHESLIHTCASHDEWEEIFMKSSLID